MIYFIFVLYFGQTKTFMHLILTQSELFLSLLVCQVFANSCATAVPQNSLKESLISPLEHLLWHNFLSGPGRKGKKIITKKKRSFKKHAQVYSQG